MSIKLFSLTETGILKIKREKKIEALKAKELEQLVKRLKIKFVIFFILTFLILSFLLFYISCFCGIYVNTQSHLIKDSLISFLLSMIHPFGIKILPCIFRIPALRAPKGDKKYIYNIKDITDV
jgi:hypothetical protein